jgi:signal transduction histidine kinase
VKALRFFPENILVVFLTVGAALAATLLFSPFVSPVASPLFLVAVMISAWRGGLFAGFLATALSALANLFFFLPTEFSFDIQREEISQFMIDIFASIIIGTLSAGRRRAENEREALLESEKKVRLEAEHANSVKDEFLAVVSHELRTPLTTIKTLTHYLRHNQPTEEEREEYLGDIASECERQIDLVHNLLDLSRIRVAGVDINLQKTDIGKVLRDCVKIERIEAAAHQHKIKIEIEKGLPYALSDASALRRSVCTMLENSIKYSPDGSLILVSAARVSDSSIAVKIKDNGRGIHPQDMPHIFESFFRGHLLRAGGGYTFSDDQEVKGIGLGLHLAKFLVEGMKGEISVESEVGKGSAFTITLNTWNRGSEN